MKKLFLMTLAGILMLAACAPAPTQAPAPLLPESTQTPVVLVQTVVVEPTQIPPTEVPPTTAPPVVVVVVQPTQESAQPTATSINASPAPIVLDDLLGKGVFKNIIISGNEISLRCVTRELTITATASLQDITEAELFYRMVDQPKALYYSKWRSAGKLKDEGNGVFSFLLTGETVHPDLRLDLGWFEFQLVGLNKGGGVIDRTQKIEQLITYRIDCP